MLTSYFHLWYLVKLRFSMVSVWILSYFYLHYMILLMSSMTNVTDLLCFFLDISRVLLSYFHPCYYFFRLSIREVISSSGCTDHIPDDKSEVPWQSAPCLSPASPSHSVTPRPATKPQNPPTASLCESQRKPPLSAPTRQPLISTFLVCKGPGILRFLSV